MASGAAAAAVTTSSGNERSQQLHPELESSLLSAELATASRTDFEGLLKTICLATKDMLAKMKTVELSD
eukprot:5386487-Pyramimonas_sp.AAC.1